MCSGAQCLGRNTSRCRIPPGCWWVPASAKASGTWATHATAGRLGAIRRLRPSTRGGVEEEDTLLFLGQAVFLCGFEEDVGQRGGSCARHRQSRQWRDRRSDLLRRAFRVTLQERDRRCCADEVTVPANQKRIGSSTEAG